MSGKAIPFADLVDPKLGGTQAETWEIKFSNVLRAQQECFNENTYKIEKPVQFEDDVSLFLPTSERWHSDKNLLR